MTILVSSITNFFSDEIKLIERAENALRSNRLATFLYDGTVGVIKATVQPSMKKGLYSVTVRCLFSADHLWQTICKYIVLC